MKTSGAGLRTFSCLMGISLLCAPAAAGQCPPADTIAKGVERTFRKKAQVKEMRPFDVEGLCEITVTIQGRSTILYSDAAGRYLISGRIVDLEQGRDLTGEKLAELNRLTPGEMKEVASLSALSFGTGGPEVYFVTDPQ